MASTHRKSVVLRLINLCIEASSGDDDSGDEDISSLSAENINVVDCLEVNESGVKKVVPQLLYLLRGCLVTHRWQEVSQVLISLMAEPHGSSHTIWKVGTQIMYNAGQDKTDLLDHFVNQLKTLNDIRVKEVVLEYVLHLLQHGKLGEAQAAAKGVPKARNDKRVAEDDADRYISTLLQLYQGLMWYIEWLTVKNKLDPLLEIGQDEDSVGVVTYKELMKTYADKATYALQVIAEKEGVWDIFITKYLEILEYYERASEARSLLQSYTSNNPLNPNAYKYHYFFEKRMSSKPVILLEILKPLIDLVPSDELALDYCRLLLQEKGDSVTFLFSLFDMLDFPQWNDRHELWSELASLLLASKKFNDKEILQAVADCWSLRSSWWPQYHFSLTAVHSSSSPTLVHKAILSVFLLGPDHEFPSSVKKYLKEEELVQLEEAILIIQNDHG